MTRKSTMKLLITAALWLLPWSLQASNSSACEAAPLPQGTYRVSSPFGMRVHPRAHVWRMHWGVDLACPRGTPVSAIRDGVVLFAGRWGCYGNVVILAHPGDVVTLYAHLSQFAAGLRRGVCVRAGEVIALSGATGCVTGPHVHVEYWVGKQQRRVNPLLICAALRVTRKAVTL